MHREGSEFDPQCDYYYFAFCPWPATDHGIRDYFCLSGGEVVRWRVGAVLNLGSTRKCFVSGASGASEHSDRQYFFLSRIITEKLTVLISMCDLVQKTLEIVI